MSWAKIKRALPYIIGAVVIVLVVIPNGVSLFTSSLKQKVTPSAEGKKAQQAALAEAQSQASKAA